MKKLVIFLLFISPLFLFSQNNKINWQSLEEAKASAKTSKKNILVYFYKKDCSYCMEMTKETLQDKEVVSIINNNFIPVKIDSRTKETITYNGKEYSNQQPISDGAWWRHDFYFEVAKFNQNGKDNITTPTVVIFNPKFQKIQCGPYGVLAGKQSKLSFLRNINRCIK